MSAGVDRVDRGSFARFGALLGPLEGRRISSLRAALFWLPTALVGGFVAWALLPASDGHVAPVDQPHSQLAALQSKQPAAGPGGGATAAAAAAELDRLRISSQTWRRGGLGSRALVTFTLRNDNDYAVKDIEILCSFSRRDGSHLTDRRRILPETVNMKSRKTFASVPVGFVNVNASQARCSLAAAQRE